MRSRIIILLALAWVNVAFDAAAESSRVELSPELFLEELATGVWRHVSSHDVEVFGVVWANGLLVVSGGEAALIDTPWTDEQVRAIAGWLGERFEARLTIAVPTHSHGDCLGGLAAAHELGAASYASNKTIELATKAGEPVPRNGFACRIDLSVGTMTVSLEEVGPGHTIDNIVVWLSGEQILFGGCLVKSSGSRGLGYIAEADLEQWPKTITAVETRFANARIVVPGHGAPGGRELLAHTKTLVEGADQ